MSPFVHYSSKGMNFSGILKVCDELGEHLGHELSKPQKLLLIERGTVEGLLTVLQGRPIKVEVTYQSAHARRTNLRDSLTDDLLVLGQTELQGENIPAPVMSDLEARGLGIGEILAKHEVETRRNIYKIGYEPVNKLIYREYDILIQGKVCFTIIESFSELLYSSSGL
jgi:chorismate-pyruvate lyase